MSEKKDRPQNQTETKPTPLPTPAPIPEHDRINKSDQKKNDLKK